MKLPRAFVVAELLHYFYLPQHRAQYRRDLLECWRDNRHGGSYQTAYGEAVRQIEAEQPH